MPTKLTNEIINAAIDGYEAHKSRIDGKIAELRAMLSGAATATTEAPKRKKRRLSAVGRRAIAEAARKRWAAAKQATEPAPQETAKPKRKLSAAGRQRIIAATKKRWAAVRAAKAQQEKAARKTVAKKKVAVKKAAPATPTSAPQLGS
jgi:hypothetical protein